MKRHPIYCENGIVISLTQNQFTIIDFEDEWVRQYNWFSKFNVCTKSFYAMRSIRIDNKQTVTVSLHREILKPDFMFQVDHINHDTLDNRRSNLRFVTASQNQMNRVKRIDNTSGVTGVYWHKRDNIWLSNITVNDKTIHLGYFENFDDAITARKEAELKYFGEYKLSL